MATIVWCKSWLCSCSEIHAGCVVITSYLNHAMSGYRTRDFGRYWFWWTRSNDVSTYNVYEYVSCCLGVAYTSPCLRCCRITASLYRKKGSRTTNNKCKITSSCVPLAFLFCRIAIHRHCLPLAQLPPLKPKIVKIQWLYTDFKQYLFHVRSNKPK